MRWSTFRRWLWVIRGCLVVSAILLGGNVTVRAGSDRGGSFQNVPACRSKTQLGCVVAFSTFNETPPGNTLFGHTTTPNEQVLCTNPAARLPSRGLRIHAFSNSSA